MAPAYSLMTGMCLTHASAVFHVWLPCGSCVVQASIMCVSQVVQMCFKGVSHVVHAWLTHGSGVVQAWLTRASSEADLWFKCDWHLVWLPRDSKIAETWLPHTQSWLAHGSHVSAVFHVWLHCGSCAIQALHMCVSQVV